MYKRDKDEEEGEGQGQGEGRMDSFFLFTKLKLNFIQIYSHLFPT